MQETQKMMQPPQSPQRRCLDQWHTGRITMQPALEVRLRPSKNRLTCFSMHEIPCQKHSACIYLLQLACVVSWNDPKVRKRFFKTNPPAHQARATTINASLQARVDFQQQSCMRKGLFGLLQHITSSCNSDDQGWQLHCLV